MKRVLLFLATNLAVVLVLSVVLNIVYAVTGMQPGSLSGLLVMAPLFVALFQRWYPSRNFLSDIAFVPIVHANDFPYSVKLLLTMLGLLFTSFAAYYFDSPEIACFVFFLAMPQMWIVYTESPFHAAVSLALFAWLLLWANK